MAHACPAPGPCRGPALPQELQLCSPGWRQARGPSVKAVTTGQAQILKAEQIHKALTASEHLSIASSLLTGSGAAAGTDLSILSPKQPGGQVLPWNLSALQLLGCSEKCEVMAALVTSARPALQPPDHRAPRELRGLCRPGWGQPGQGSGGRCHPGCHTFSPLEMSCLR